MSSNKRVFFLASYLFLFPNLVVWGSAFYAEISRNIYSINIIESFRELPKIAQIIVELIFPLLAFFFATQGQKGLQKIMLITASVFLTLAAVLVYTFFFILSLSLGIN